MSVKHILHEDGDSVVYQRPSGEIVVRDMRDSSTSGRTVWSPSVASEIASKIQTAVFTFLPTSRR